MRCKICSQENNLIFSAKILKKYDVKYYFCEICGYLQTEEPYWLEEAYIKSINLYDTGIIKRNLYLTQISTIIINLYFNKNKKYLDFAGGYGIFTRLMRDVGFDFYWIDKYSENLVAQGFEYQENEKYELLTSFESFEHFEYPLKEIEHMLKISKNILFSTELIKDKPATPGEWEYYGFEHGQHISFYSIKTLKYIAKKYDLNLYSYGIAVHLLTEKIISPMLFKLILEFNRLGLFHIFKMKNKSKTFEDSKLFS
jgi:hypothetical protein